MNAQLLLNAVVIVVLIGFVAYRQLTWRIVDPARMIRLPLALAIVGVVTMAGATKGGGLHASDVGILAVELVLSLVLGSLMGLLARFRPIGGQVAPTRHDRGRGGREPSLESRTGWLGVALWVVFIGIRIGVDLWAVHAGSVLASSTGVILIMVAANRLARTGVIAYRTTRPTSIAV